MMAPNGNNFGGYSQQPPQYNQQYHSQPQQGGGVSGAMIAAIIAGIVALIAVAAMVIMFVTNNKSDATTSAAADSQFQQAASSGSSNDHSWGDYTSYYAATNKTSNSFAGNVYTAFMNNWVAGGGTEATLSVYSPVTGGTYTMYCLGSSSSLTCSGGDNARVVIY